MPVNSKKQGQDQAGKKGDDAKTKAGKSSSKVDSVESNKKPLYNGKSK